MIRPGLQDLTRWGDHPASAHGNNLVACGVVETKSDLPGTPNELSVYSLEGYCSDNGARLRRYTFRLDGFVSVQAPLSGGEMLTRPLIFEGSR